MARSGLQHVHRDERRCGSRGQGLRQHEQSKLRRAPGKGSAYFAGFAVDGCRKRYRRPRGRSAQTGGTDMKVSSRVVVIPQENIDTDQIIPARFLKVTDKAGLGANLFADRPEFRALIASGSQVLVAGNNFGCGSSREHAPWALGDFGFRAVVSTSFASIFRNNCLKNGLLPIAVEPAFHRKMVAAAGGGGEAAAVAAPPTVTIDLEARTITLADGTCAAFPIEPFPRYCLLNGLDELTFLLQQEEAISAHERRGATGRRERLRRIPATG